MKTEEVSVTVTEIILLNILVVSVSQLCNKMPDSNKKEKKKRKRCLNEWSLLLFM
jgi:hypothetical protein